MGEKNWSGFQDQNGVKEEDRNLGTIIYYETQTGGGRGTRDGGMGGWKMGEGGSLPGTPPSTLLGGRLHDRCSECQRPDAPPHQSSTSPISSLMMSRFSVHCQSLVDDK